MASSSAGTRSRTLDVFRGASVALMILVNNPGSWNHLYPPLAHAPWHGCTATDLVFPFFLTAVGLSLALVMPRFQTGPPAHFWARWARRGVLIFAIGLALNSITLWRFEGAALVLKDGVALRYMGVLQRIALAWMLAAALLWLWRVVLRVGAGTGQVEGGPGASSLRAPLWLAASLLLAYWAMCEAWGQPGQVYSLEGHFGTAIDRAWLGPAHLYQGEGAPFDPEGLASTLPAVAQVLLGVAIGQWLQPVLLGQASAAERRQRVVALMVWATVALATAHLWSLAMPINKKLWTSPYVLHTTGLAMLTLGALLHWLEGEKPTPAARPTGAGGAALRAVQGGWQSLAQALASAAESFGKNALAIFVLSGLVPRLLAFARWPDGVDAQGEPRYIHALGWVHSHVFEPLANDPRLGSLLMALANLAAYWAVARWMQRRGWFLKL